MPPSAPTPQLLRQQRLEGGGGACSPGSPLPRAWELLRCPPPWADRTAPWLGWGQPCVTQERKKNLLVPESPSPVQGGPWSGRGGGRPSRPALQPGNKELEGLSRLQPRGPGDPRTPSSRFPGCLGAREARAPSSHFHLTLLMLLRCLKGIILRSLKLQLLLLKFI